MYMNHSLEASLGELEQLSLKLIWQLRLDMQRAFEPLGISPMQGFALFSIQQGVHQPSALAFVMDLSAPSVSQLLSGLEARGWLERELDSNNRRQIRILLTQEGQAFLDKMREHWKEVSCERYARLTPEEINMLIQSFHKLIDPQVVER